MAIATSRSLISKNTKWSPSGRSRMARCRIPRAWTLPIIDYLLVAESNQTLVKLEVDTSMNLGSWGEWIGKQEKLGKGWTVWGEPMISTMTRQPDAFTSQDQLARWPCLRRLTRTTSSFSEKFRLERYRHPAFG